MSRVTLIEERPSISETTLGLTRLESRSVAEIVEADRRQAGPLQERLERTVSKVGRVGDRARLRSENESARLVELAYPLYLLQLAREVGPERGHGARREPDGAPAPCCFWLSEDASLIRVGENAAHAQHATL